MFERYGVGTKDFIYDYENNKYVIPVFANGQWGYWQKRRSFDYSSENYDEDGSGTTATLVLLPDLFVPLKHSLSHYRTMANPIVQAIHQGQRDFVNNPFGGSLMAFLSGGGLGGGAIAGRAFSGLKALSPVVMKGGVALGQVGRTGMSVIARNIAQTGARNIALNLSVQTLFNDGDFGEIDIADALISGVSGNSFIFAGLSSAFIHGTTNRGFETAANKTFYETSVNASTGIIFGYAGGSVGTAIGPGFGGFASELTIGIFGGLFNWTLSPPSKN
ncbi:MAG: hypothetical protein KF763_19930 [Cyclobacteriaceae bacterium]|nr:hypothetical protein [Cyclobacteriaceae bacterium]